MSSKAEEIQRARENLFKSQAVPRRTTRVGRNQAVPSVSGTSSVSDKVFNYVQGQRGVPLKNMTFTVERADGSVIEMQKASVLYSQSAKVLFAKGDTVTRDADFMKKKHVELESLFNQAPTDFSAAAQEPSEKVDDLD